MPFDPTDPEYVRSRDPTSTFSNRAYVTIVDGAARVSFGEAPGGFGDAKYHTAVTMAPADLLALADAIYATVDEAYPRPPPLPRHPTLPPKVDWSKIRGALEPPYLPDLPPSLGGVLGKNRKP